MKKKVACEHLDYEYESYLLETIVEGGGRQRLRQVGGTCHRVAVLREDYHLIYHKVFLYQDVTCVLAFDNHELTNLIFHLLFYHGLTTMFTLINTSIAF